jgi:hypothetical protein
MLPVARTSQQVVILVQARTAAIIAIHTCSCISPAVFANLLTACIRYLLGAGLQLLTSATACCATS